MLAEALGERALLVREPGGTELGERLRELLKDQRVAIEPPVEALLFAAARGQLAAEVIRPALANGRVVVCDRFLDSSLAYQGAARGLGIEAVEAINDFALDGLRPDLTFLLEIDPAAAAQRDGTSDRFEAAGSDFQQAVAAAYRALAERFPERYVRLDATLPVTELHGLIYARVRAALAAGAGSRREALA